MKKTIINVNISDSYVIKGRQHNSVGMEFILEYDKTVFNVFRSFSYNDPRYNDPKFYQCGGDDGVLTYIIHFKKSGKFSFCANQVFRGDVESSDTYIFNIKRSYNIFKFIKNICRYSKLKTTK